MYFQTCVSGAHGTDSYMTTLHVIITALQTGWDKIQWGCSLHFSALTNISKTPPQYCKASFCCTFALKLTTVDRTGLLRCIACYNAVACFICTHKLLGSVSALFTCSLLLHLKVVGEALFGCPPFPRHILCSAQFLLRQVCRESKAECGGVQSNTQKKSELLSSDCTQVWLRAR